MLPSTHMSSLLSLLSNSDKSECNQVPTCHHVTTPLPTSTPQSSLTCHLPSWSPQPLFIFLPARVSCLYKRRQDANVESSGVHILTCQRLSLLLLLQLLLPQPHFADTACCCHCCGCCCCCCQHAAVAVAVSGSVYLRVHIMSPLDYRALQICVYPS